MRWIRRILWSLLGTVIAIPLLFGGVIGLDAAFGATATDFTNVTYEAADGTTLNGYLAMPEGEGSFPAVLMVHEWWGINGEMTELADAMAQEGYVVLAPDTYRGPTTNQVPRAIFLRITVDEAQVDSDMQAAFDYLAALPEVDAEHIGVIGFCYGGGVALRHGIQNPQIAATINLYGDTPADAEGFGALVSEQTPLLGIFGGQDQQIPLADVQAFEDALTQAGVDHTITVYEGQGHAFVQPDVIEAAGEPREAWLQILDFFETHLATSDADSAA